MESTVSIRAWKKEDAGFLASISNNRKIWLNVRDRFPYPYTVKDAVAWIEHSQSKQPAQSLAIIFNGEVAGSIGITPKDDVYRKSIEVGYFLGEAYWGKGIATIAVKQLIEYISSNFNVIRIYAEVFDHNVASMKVLQKNGFHLEGIRKKAVIKNNVVMDDYVWVLMID